MCDPWHYAHATCLTHPSLAQAAAGAKDADRTAARVATVLADVSALELLQAPGLPFILPRDYAELPRLTGVCLTECAAWLSGVRTETAAQFANEQQITWGARRPRDGAPGHRAQRRLARVPRLRGRPAAQAGVDRGAGFCSGRLRVSRACAHAHPASPGTAWPYHHTSDYKPQP